MRSDNQLILALPAHVTLLVDTVDITKISLRHHTADNCVCGGNSCACTRPSIEVVFYMMDILDFHSLSRTSLESYRHTQTDDCTETKRSRTMESRQRDEGKRDQGKRDQGEGLYPTPSVNPSLSPLQTTIRLLVLGFEIHYSQHSIPALTLGDWRGTESLLFELSSRHGQLCEL